MIHACAVMAGYRFEEFIEKLVDSEAIDYENPTAFIIQNSPTREILLGMFSKYVKLGRKGSLRV